MTDIKNFIVSAINNSPAINPFSNQPHFERTEGSHIVEGPKDDASIRAMLAEADWTENTEEVFAMGAGYGTCRYFTAPLPEGIKAVEAAWTYGEFFEQVKAKYGDEALALNVITKGRHQHEALSDLLDPQPTQVICLAIGDWGGHYGVDGWAVNMWAPGRMLPIAGVIKWGEVGIKK
jgi:hypothetical protein